MHTHVPVRLPPSAGPVMQGLVAPGYLAPSFCSSISPPMLAATILPYLIRFVQCLVVYRTTGNKAQVCECACARARVCV